MAPVSPATAQTRVAQPLLENQLGEKMHAIINHPVLSTLIAVGSVCLFALIAQVVLIASGDDQEKMQFPWQ